MNSPRLHWCCQDFVSYLKRLRDGSLHSWNRTTWQTPSARNYRLTAVFIINTNYESQQIQTPHVVWQYMLQVAWILQNLDVLVERPVVAPGFGLRNFSNWQFDILNVPLPMANINGRFWRKYNFYLWFKFSRISPLKLAKFEKIKLRASSTLSWPLPPLNSAMGAKGFIMDFLGLASRLFRKGLLPTRLCIIFTNINCWAWACNELSIFHISFISRVPVVEL